MDGTIVALKAENKRLQSESKAAASLGLELLNENRELKQKIAKSGTANLNDYEAIVQENYSLKKRLETKESLENEAERQISSLQGRLKSAREAISQELEETFDRKYSALTKKKAGLEHELEETRKVCRSAQLKVEELERDAAMRKRIQDDSLLSSPSDRSYNKLSMECQSLTEENNTLQGLVHDLRIELDSAENGKKKWMEKLKEWKESAENLESTAQSYRTKITSMQEEMDEMRCAMSELQASQGLSKKGNSVYGELDEQRRLVEAEMMNLHEKQKRLLVENGKLEKEVDRWKRKCAANLRAASESVASEEQVRMLKEELDRTRGELRLERNRKIKALEQAPRELITASSSNASVTTDTVLRERIDMLQRENRTIGLESERLRLERTCTQDELIQEQKKRFQLEERLREVERQKDFLRSQIEELQSNLKHGPSHLSTSMLSSRRPKLIVAKTLGDEKPEIQQPCFEDTMDYSVDSSAMEGKSENDESQVSASATIDDNDDTSLTGTASNTQDVEKENVQKREPKRRRAGRKVHTGIAETEEAGETAGECKQQ